jgi:glycosyltransferase involved in cell wall biosynthesis
MNNIKISIVIPCYNDFQNVLELVDSINSSKGFEASHDEIILINDGSKEPTPISLSKKQNTCVLNLPSNHGPAYARNYGVLHSKNPWILFLDSDTRVYGESIMNLKIFLNGNSQANIVNGYCTPDPINYDLGSRYKGLVEYVWHLEILQKSVRPEIFNSRIGVIKKQLFQELGGFNIEIKSAALEEHEFSFRIPSEIKIHLLENFLVQHDFPNIKQTTKVYWNRSSKWVHLFLRNRRFEHAKTTAGTSSKNALGHVFGFFIIFCLFFIPSYSFFVAILISLNFIFFIIYLKFFSYAFKVSWLFLLECYLLHLYYSVVIVLASLCSLVGLFFRRILKIFY